MASTSIFAPCFSKCSNRHYLGWIAFMMFILQGIEAMAQAPTVSYPSPQIYYKSSVISSLSPSAANVPALTFSNVTTYAGTATAGGSNTSAASTSTFNNIKSVVMDRHGNMYVAEFTDGRI